MKHLGLLLALVAFVAFAPSAHAASGMFSSEASAAASCPGDTVVFTRFNTRVFYMKTQANYGKVSGAYACEQKLRAQGFDQAKDQ